MNSASGIEPRSYSQGASAIAAVLHENLRLFCILRLIPLGGMFYGAYYLLDNGGETLQWDFILVLLAIFTLVIGLGWARSYWQTAIRPWEFLGHLLLDVLIFGLLMYNTGGATNPFVSYLLVPVTIAAIALPSSLTWATGLACLATYSALLFWYVPLPAVAPGHSMSGGHHNHGLNLHIIGMWLNFIVSALLIAYFVNKMATTIAVQEQSLSLQQQKRLEDDQLLAVATVAASAAHELGTPLNTMKLISDEWQSAAIDNAILREDMSVLHSQIERCQQTLQKLSGRARKYSGAGLVTQKAREYFADLMEDWAVMRPDVNASWTIRDSDSSVDINYHPSLSASIHNLLNNAGDASPGRVEVTVFWDRSMATVEIRDFGQGLNATDAPLQPGISDKPGGMGLGLYLARTILARHGASLTLQAAPDQGTLIRIDLPLRHPNE